MVGVSVDTPFSQAAWAQKEKVELTLRAISSVPRAEARTFDERTFPETPSGIVCFWPDQQRNGRMSLIYGGAVPASTTRKPKLAAVNPGSKCQRQDDNKVFGSSS